MYSRENLLPFFVSGSETPKFLDFKTRKTISESKAIRMRELATTKSLESESLDDAAGLEGSPSFKVIDTMLEAIEASGCLPDLQGLGMEMGSGLGLLSASIIKRDSQKKISGILALEAGLPFVTEGISRASREVLGDNSYRILPCYGSFDKIAIASKSIDFIFQIEALHHADELAPPIREAYRLLKSGGYFISIDRSWPDEVTSLTLKELLDHEYESEWLLRKGFPSDAPFTRRDNGEHEYRDREWFSAFKEAGFIHLGTRHIHPEVKIFHIMKRLVTFLGLRKILKMKIPSRSGVLRGLLNSKGFFAIPGGLILTSHPRALTVTIWQK